MQVGFDERISHVCEVDGAPFLDLLSVFRSECLETSKVNASEVLLFDSSRFEVKARN